MAFISTEIPFGDMMMQVNGFYYPAIEETQHDAYDPSEFVIDSFTFEGYDVLSELSEMYIKTKYGRYISYLESIDSELCAKADEAYCGQLEEQYADYD